MASLRTGSNLIQVRSGNLSVVLETVRRLGLVSRTELTVSTNLTPSTITNLVNELIEEKLLFEAGSSASQGGRKRTLLSMNPAARWVIALTVQADVTRGALVDLCGNIGWSCTKPLSLDADNNTIGASCDAVISQLVETATEYGWPVLGVGLVYPNAYGGEGWQAQANWWRNWVPAGFHHAQVRTEYNMRAAALGEAWFGAGRESDSLVYLDCDQTINLGVIMERRLFTGAHGQAAIASSCLQAGYGIVPESGITDTMLLDAIRFAACVYDPEVIVIGGPAVASLEGGTPGSGARLARLLATEFDLTSIKVAPASHEITLVGAACLVLEGFFANPLGYFHYGDTALSPRSSLCGDELSTGAESGT